MRKFKPTMLAGALAIAAFQVAGPAVATPLLGDGLNKITSDNFENLYRKVANCTAANPCLADAANPANGTSFLAPPAGIIVPSVPAGWAYPSPFTLTPNVIAGDVFAGIFNYSGIENLTAGINWAANPATGDQLMAYFATEVINVYAGGLNAGPPITDNDPYSNVSVPPDPVGDLQLLDHIDFRSAGANDPFGILTGSEVMRMYVDLPTPWTAVQTLANQLANITAGTLWATFGMGADPTPGSLDPDGFGYSHVPLGTSPSGFNGEAFFAMNFITNNTGRLFDPINDTNENELGGSTVPPNTGLCFGPATCTDFILDVGQLNANQQGWILTGDSEWGFQSGDDAFLYARVPEPTSLALLAAGLLGLAGIRRRSNHA